MINRKRLMFAVYGILSVACGTILPQNVESNNNIAIIALACGFMAITIILGTFCTEED